MALQGASALVVGCGGVGSAIAASLAASGVDAPARPRAPDAAHARRRSRHGERSDRLPGGGPGARLPVQGGTDLLVEMIPPYLEIFGSDDERPSVGAIARL